MAHLCKAANTIFMPNCDRQVPIRSGYGVNWLRVFRGVPRRDWIWAGPDKSAKLLVFWGWHKWLDAGGDKRFQRNCAPCRAAGFLGRREPGRVVARPASRGREKLDETPDKIVQGSRQGAVVERNADRRRLVGATQQFLLASKVAPFVRSFEPGRPCDRAAFFARCDPCRSSAPQAGGGASCARISIISAKVI